MADYFYMVDGVEYDPGGFTAAGGTTSNLLGLGANDSGLSRTLDTRLDSIVAGYSGYGSSELFTDDFSGSGFSLWDSWNPGSPTCLDETGGNAVLSVTGDIIGGPDIQKLHDTPYRNTYWQMLVKCTNPPSSDPASPAFTLVDGHAFALYSSDGVTFMVGGDSEFRAVALDDGDWHLIGIRRYDIDNPLPPTDLSGSINHTFGLG